ncbi:MAG: hypothetical protein IGR93_22510 [Hydrococcus sp. C42_A2020_068]|nr:hypothetical protein [Hydrococcus sp. C42_A2020_068]
MHNLTEIDQAIGIGISAGFVSGVVYGAIDEVSELLIKSREISLGNTIRKCIVLGCTMAIILGVMTFAFISITSIPIQIITQVIVVVAISFVVVGLFAGKVFEMISSKIFSQR